MTLESEINLLLKDSGFSYVSHKESIICLKDKYGLYEISLKSLSKGCFPTIKTSLNKTEVFISRAIEVHGCKYEYKDLYVGMKIPFRIECETHGIFTQTPDNHLKGKGCMKCGHLSTSVNNKRTRMAFH